MRLRLWVYPQVLVFHHNLFIHCSKDIAFEMPRVKSNLESFLHNSINCIFSSLPQNSRYLTTFLFSRSRCHGNKSNFNFLKLFTLKSVPLLFASTNHCFSCVQKNAQILKPWAFYSNLLYDKWKLFRQYFLCEVSWQTTLHSNCYLNLFPFKKLV